MQTNPPHAIVACLILCLIVDPGLAASLNRQPPSAGYLTTAVSIRRQDNFQEQAFAIRGIFQPGKPLVDRPLTSRFFVQFAGILRQKSHRYMMVGPALTGLGWVVSHFPGQRLSAAAFAYLAAKLILLGLPLVSLSDKTLQKYVIFDHELYFASSKELFGTQGDIKYTLWSVRSWQDMKVTVKPGVIRPATPEEITAILAATQPERDAQEARHLELYPSNRPPWLRLLELVDEFRGNARKIAESLTTPASVVYVEDAWRWISKSPFQNLATELRMLGPVKSAA